MRLTVVGVDTCYFALGLPDALQEVLCVQLPFESTPLGLLLLFYLAYTVLNQLQLVRLVHYRLLRLPRHRNVDLGQSFWTLFARARNAVKIFVFLKVEVDF